MQQTMQNHSFHIIRTFANTRCDEMIPVHSLKFLPTVLWYMRTMSVKELSWHVGLNAVSLVR